MIKTAQRLEGIGEYYFATKLREIDQLNKDGKNIISLGIGSPDLPPHPEVIKVLQDESSKANVHAYQSYKGSPVLRNAIADWYKQWYQVELNPETEVLPLIGSKEGIMHICMTYLDNGDQVLVPNPGYPTYRSAVKLAGGVCVDYNLSDETQWEPDFEAIEKQDLSKVKLMWINYPQMPTGKLPSEELFKKIVAFGKKHDILICHDNPYSFILNDKPASILNVEGAKEVALELNSLSKSQNMAGWRIGMLVGAAERINEVMRFKSNMDSGMFLPVQLAAAKALGLGKEWYAELNRIYAGRRSKVFELLDLLGCTYDRSQAGMFVWARIPSNEESGYKLSDKVLYGANVFITPGGIFGSAGDNYVRVSLCCKDENIEAAKERIKKSL
ncbi:MAG: aminotransferase class I/II-fold pyridoxal phosphate-dependent enzyme [Flavitalea sp.]